MSKPRSLKALLAAVLLAAAGSAFAWPCSDGAEAG